ncbi:MAG: Eco57I restriction-modification methylase domain-containing protein [Alloprevotella sp.]
MENSAYNPDVLNCIANLSNDEVFTPPALANQVLDTLPQELFRSPDTTFLDPFCKSGVFLREIVKRLDVGLKERIPDRRKRIDHIMHRQVFGIALTELTALLSRRTLYCSKSANGPHSVSHFDDAQGNVRYEVVRHTWQHGKCRYCGASKEVYDRGDASEQYAYQFIHTDNPEKLFPKNMTFDVIIGNPPYQMSDGGSKASASPIYHLFVEQAKKLKPRYLTMIIPSRWFTGGKGLDSFRDSMLNDDQIRYMKDYVNAKDCFPGLSVSGGICIFLWERDYSGLCNFVSVNGNISSSAKRKLNEFPVFVRYNNAVNIIHKILKRGEKSVKTILTSRNPFGIPTNVRGTSRKTENYYKLFSSKGEGYISEREILSNKQTADSYKVMLTRIMCEHAGEPDKDGLFKVIATIKLLRQKEVCTDTYIVAGAFNNEKSALCLKSYLKTKFVRFLVLQAAASINLSKATYSFVPLQDFSHPWTDEMLYKKYGLDEKEIAFIESMIRPME